MSEERASARAPRRAKSRRSRTALGLLIGSLVLPCFAHPGRAQSLPARTIEREGSDAAMPGLEAFVDGVVASHMAEHVAGSAVAVVKDGRALLVKGYGIARVTPEQAVDPERHLFRLASISKTFTWLALMQLVDVGKLRLDDDVNKHLPRDLQLPKEGWSKPVRVLDLMNHTAGFEEPVWLDDPSDETLLRSLREHLATHRPARVREPGKLFAYSNYGAALAGAIVAHVSGMEFESYAEQHIFAPLGMRGSTFREAYGAGAPAGLPAPMPSELAEARAMALSWKMGRWQVEPRHYLSTRGPAGAASSTASDMARYMIALLDPAALERLGVLSVHGAETFRQRSFEPAKGLRGLHHGLMDSALGRHCKLGYANLSHSGNAAYFESFMVLVPELGLGVFVTSNSASGVNLSRDLPEQLVRHYFPPQAPARPTPVSAPVLAQYAGQYRDVRRSYTKLPALFSMDQVLEIALGDNDCLLVPLPSSERACFKHIGRDLFEKVDGDSRLSFLRDARGDVTHVVGALNAERVGLLDSGAWLRFWLLAGLLVALGVIGGALWRVRKPSVQPLLLRLAASCTVLMASSWLAFYLAGVSWQLIYGADALRDYPQPLLIVGLRLLVAAVTLSVLAVLMLPLVWRGPSWPLARRLRHTLVLVVLIGVCLALRRWNVIGFNYF